jgi:hypothetical protein
MSNCGLYHYVSSIRLRADNKPMLYILRKRESGMRLKKNVRRGEGWWRSNPLLYANFWPH